MSIDKKTFVFKPSVGVQICHRFNSFFALNLRIEIEDLRINIEDDKLPLNFTELNFELSAAEQENCTMMSSPVYPTKVHRNYFSSLCDTA